MSKDLTFQVEGYLAIEHELARIIPDHHDELMLEEQHKKWDPDYARYRGMASAGIIHIPTARNAAGDLVGYWIFFVLPNLHHKSITTAYCDLLYLRPAYRGEHRGMRFGEFMLTTLEALAVGEAYCSTKVHRSYGPYFEKLGFFAIETLYTRLFTKPLAKHEVSA